MERLRILVLFGGCSSEHEVSLQSAHGVLTHMDPERYCPIPVGITREGAWYVYTGPLDAIPGGRWQREAACVPCTLRLDRGNRALVLLDGSGREVAFDLAFPVLHGRNGEDGTVQGALELAGVPLVGCGTLSSALCMDKDRSHKLAALAGVRVPRSRLFRRTVPLRAPDAAETLGRPLFVKPVRAGSSFGVSRVESRHSCSGVEAPRHDGEFLLEEASPGFEVGCAVLGNRELTVGAVDEVELSRGFFNYTEKYTLQTSAIHCPARIAPQKAAEIRETAKVLYRALGCRGFARVDLFLTPWGEIVFNEVNTIPGFTPHSRYPAMMRAAGIPFRELVSRLIQLGAEL
ncbi:MAG: D-alanine--D-alanine ligase family protein [Dysosmobacter welbionis]